ncbi:MAG: hypothetical protein WCB18_07090, partial [Thermoplasmata archaeon]
MRHVTNLRTTGPTAPAFRLALVVGLVLLLGTTALRTPVALPVPGSPLVPAISGPCLGLGVPTKATGTLALVGTSTPLPSITGVSVRVDYFYTEETTTGADTNESCVPTSASSLTGSGGSIAVPLPLPVSRCVSGVCVDYLGPYGPLGYATSGAPAGFFEQDPTNGTNSGAILWDADLYTAQMNRTGSHVVSVNALVSVSASAWNVVGTPAPGPLSYTWNLTGLDWFPSGLTAPNITVQGKDSTWVGSLSVTVQGSYGGTTESARSPVLSLDPLATTASSATTSPNPLDPGVPVTFVATGNGAAGYPYTLTVDPGAGTLPMSAPCEPTPLVNGTVNVTCQVEAAYPTAGNVTPTGSISNGDSSASLSFLPIAVHPVEQVSLTATKYVTYPNRTVVLTVTVTNGTGSSPYGPACLSVNAGSPLTCQPPNGTSWVFNESFPTPDNYTVRAFVADRFGENVSAAAEVVIVPTLTVRVNGSASISVPANETHALVAVVAGGALPIQAVWNSSGTTRIACPNLIVSDGAVPCNFSVSSPVRLNVTLTLTDALGSVASVVFRVTVTAASVPPSSRAAGALPTATWV